MWSVLCTQKYRVAIVKVVKRKMGTIIPCNYCRCYERDNDKDFIMLVIGVYVMECKLLK